MHLEENDMRRYLVVARNAGPFRPFRQRQLEVILAHWTLELATALMEGLKNLYTAVKR